MSATHSQATGPSRDGDIIEQPIFEAVGGYSRIYDQERYRSLFSVCIQRNGKTKPVGVCVAFSDVVGRFTNENSTR